MAWGLLGIANFILGIGGSAGNDSGGLDLGDLGSIGGAIVAALVAIGAGIGWFLKRSEDAQGAEQERRRESAAVLAAVRDVRQILGKPEYFMPKHWSERREPLISAGIEHPDSTVSSLVTRLVSATDDAVSSTSDGGGMGWGTATDTEREALVGAQAAAKREAAIRIAEEILSRLEPQDAKAPSEPNVAETPPTT